MTATFYDVLGVAPDATGEEIQAAYREQVKRHHPDVSDHPDAEARFRAVVRAEEVLGDPDERARYDRLGHEAYLRVVGGPEPAADPTDLVDDPPTGAGDGSDPGADRRSTPERGHGTSTVPSDDGGSTGSGRSRAATERASPADESRGSTDATDEAWWREAWEPGTGEDNWRQAADPERRSYTPGDADASTAGRAAEVAAAAARERKRRQAAGRRDDESFWTAEVDPRVEQSPGDGQIAGNVRSRDTAVLSITLLIVYPVFVYFSVAPTAPVITVAAAAATAGVAVVSLVEPSVSLIVFGIWSAVSPLLLTFLGHPLLSITGLAVLAAFWVPLALTGLVAVVAPW